ncbi:MAG: hypothetical protein ACN4GT_07310 [Gammaproteobacteria bacterium]
MMKGRTRLVVRWCKLLAVAIVAAGLGGCDDPQVYGSIGVSSGFNSWGGGGSRVGGSVSIGGRIM